LQKIVRIGRHGAFALSVVAGLYPQVASSEDLPVGGCVREDLDRQFFPPHSVCIQRWQGTDGIIYEAPGVDMGEMDETSYGFFAGVNKIRLEEGLLMVRSSRYLDNIARIRVRQMTEEGIFSHYESGCDVRFDECAYVRRLLGQGATEILGRTNAPKDEVLGLIMPAFKKSHWHHATMVRPDVQSAGVAWEVTPGGFFYVAIVFDIPLWN